MEISREDFERVVESCYMRGRVNDKIPITQKEIKSCISDVYDFLDIQPDTDPDGKTKT